MTTTKIRKSVPLEPADSKGLSCLRADSSWQQAALEIGGVELSENPSEAEALHAMLVVGRQVLAERATEKTMAQGYAALAAAETDEDRQVARLAGRRAASRLHEDD